jgi:hypothetical protein
MSIWRTLIRNLVKIIYIFGFLKQLSFFFVSKFSLSLSVQFYIFIQSRGFRNPKFLIVLVLHIKILNSTFSILKSLKSKKTPTKLYLIKRPLLYSGI